MRRVLSFLLLAASMALAGCASDEPDPPAGTTPSGTTPAGTTPATSTPPASTPATSTPPSPTPTAQPKVVYNGTHDFAGPPAAPNAPPKTENFTVDAGYARLQVRIVYSGASGPAGDINLNAGSKVRVLDPAGDEVLACTGDTCEEEITPATAGDWNVEYTGTGTQRVSVTVTEAP